MNNKNGLVKKYWSDVRVKVKSVEPEFASIVDELSPGKDFPVYLAYYHFGAVDADTVSTLFPDGSGGYYRLTDCGVPKDVAKHLGYSANNTPFSMVLEKQIESFIDLKSQNITIPWMVYKPGDMFPFTRVLHTKNKKIYSPNGLLSSTAGSRSIFMLPNIGSSSNHANIQRDFNVRPSTPKSLYEHWGIFREIANSKVVESDWRCCVMYFSEKWLTMILHDDAWNSLKKYLHEVAWHQFEFEINRINYDIIFSIIQKNNNLKPNPYLADTAKHLIALATGSVPAYSPLVEEESAPIKVLQDAFVNSYGLRKYDPTIIGPCYFDFDGILPAYYSLHHPSTHVFSPKSREASSTLYEMRELEHLMGIFKRDLASEIGMCMDTVVSDVAKRVNFDFYHNKTDQHGVVMPSQKILDNDARYQQVSVRGDSSRFSADSPFLRGCIRISSAAV